MTKPPVRKCRLCGKSKGCFSFVLKLDGKTVADYWHVKCFQVEKERQVEKTETEED